MAQLSPPLHLAYFNHESLVAFLKTVEFGVIDGFSNFPIEFYLWRGPNNYTKRPSLGPGAHTAGVSLALSMAEKWNGCISRILPRTFRCRHGACLIATARPYREGVGALK